VLIVVVSPELAANLLYKIVYTCTWKFLPIKKLASLALISRIPTRNPSGICRYAIVIYRLAYCGNLHPAVCAAAEQFYLTSSTQLVSSSD